jgi:MFS family permease
MTILVVAMQIGMWLGYVTFGFTSDAWGRKPTYVLYLLIAAAALFAYSVTRSAIVLLVLGPVSAFFGTGYYTGLGTVTSEIYNTSVRATAQGFTYNVGRIASALAPFTVGSLAETRGFGAAFRVAAMFFALAAAFWIFIPETRNRRSLDAR